MTKRVLGLEERALLVLLVELVLALEHRVEALDGGDADLGRPGRCVFELQVLDVVQLGELAAVVGRDELLELLERLPAEVGAVDQEQDALGAGELDQAVDRR